MVKYISLLQVHYLSLSLSLSAVTADKAFQIDEEFVMSEKSK